MNFEMVTIEHETKCRAFLGVAGEAGAGAARAERKATKLDAAARPSENEACRRPRAKGKEGRARSSMALGSGPLYFTL